VRDGPKYAWRLHLTLTSFLVVMWSITLFLVLTPGNRIREMGLEMFLPINFTLGVLVAFSIAVISFRNRRTCPLLLFFVTQLLALGHSIGFVVLIVYAAFNPTT